MSVCVCVRGVSLRPSCVMCAHMCLRERKGGGGEVAADREKERERERGKLQIRLYLQISCQKEPFKGNALVPAPQQPSCLFKKQKTTMNPRHSNQAGVFC